VVSIVLYLRNKMNKTIQNSIYSAACAALVLTAATLAGCSGNSGSYDSEAQAIDPAFQDTQQTEPSDMNDSDAPHDDVTALAFDAYDATIGQDKVELTEDEWRAILSDAEFHILRRSGTERAGTGRYLNNDQAGAYHCAGCGQRLYDAKNKFHSTCGWPAFNSEVAEGALTYIQDTSAGMLRTEMRCSRCDGHMGHVFDDGQFHGQDLPTRHCVNGGAVIFVPEGRDPQEVIRQHRLENAHR